jgi:von Willebrand factor type A domain
VLDASLSMQHGERWQRALDEADKILGELGSADRVMLVTGNGRRIDVVHSATPAGNAGTLRAALRTLKPGIERLDYGLVMSTANNWLGSPRPATILHLVSDLQHSAAPLRFADLEPPPRTQLAMHDVGGEPAGNVFIENAALAALDTRTLEVRIRSGAEQPQQREVVLAIDGKEYARRRVEVPAAKRVPVTVPVRIDIEGGRSLADHARELSMQMPEDDTAAGVTTARFPDLRLAAGSHRLEVSLEPQDELPQDDRYYAVIEHAEPKALLIAQETSSDEAAYFAAAIDSLAAPRLAVEQRAAGAIDSRSLAGYSIAVVTDTGALSSGAAERIKDYVAAGGAVLATLGAGPAESTPLLDGLRIGQPRTRAVHVGEIATTHPVLREAADWHRVRFLRQRPVEVTGQDKVLIAYDDGAPLLIERTIGAGRLLLLTAPVDRTWNDLAIHPLFVRFIAEAARYLLGHDAAPASSTVGSMVMTGLTAGSGGQIFDPRGERVLGLAQTAAVDRLIPDLSGFYEVRGNAGLRWLAVNVDTRESDLTALPPAFVQRWQALRVREPATSAAAAAEADSEPRSLGPWLLWLAAVLLVAELLLANRYLAIRREVPR